MTAPSSLGTDLLEDAWSPRRGFVGWIGQVNHKPIGRRFIVTAFSFFLFAGILAVLMRTQLAVPNNDVLGAERYNQFFTMHGTLMMFVFMVPMLEGIALYVLPLMLGTRDLPFPRLTAFGYWSYLLGGLFLMSSFFVGAVPEDGWFAYVPLTTAEYSAGMNMDFWLLGITFLEISGIVAAIELIVLILLFRAPGMALSRMPLFAWSILGMAFMILFAFPPLIAGTILLELERKFGLPFFTAEGGGDPLLWQHLFWFFGHPEVYIQLLPALGIVSTIVPIGARRRLGARNIAAAAIIAIAIVSFGLWVHHMYAVGLPLLAGSFFQAASFMITIPSGTLIFIYIATMWTGRIAWSTAMLFAVGFIALFVMGGITGVMVAIVPFDWQVHDSYFVVAHFHYVLLGGVLFPIFAALYHWFPKMTGLRLNEGLGQWNFWLMFIGFNLTFFPLHIVGLLGMPRRVWTYEDGLGWNGLNLTATIGGFVLAAGVAVFLANVLRAYRRKPRADDNPWMADSLEWSVTSPPPRYNFRSPPVVRSPYPLWDQNGTAPDANTEKLGQRLAQPPGRIREALRTSALDATPLEIAPQPSFALVPLADAVAIGLVLLGILIDAVPALVTGLAAVVVITVIWLWPGSTSANPSPGLAVVEPVTPAASGIRGYGWWGFLIGIFALLVLIGSLVMSYIYIRWGHDVWPPKGIPMPEPGMPFGGAAAVWGAAAVGGFAARSRRRGDARLLRGSLVAVLALGAFALWLRRQSYIELPFGWSEHVYGALFYTLGGVEAVVIFIGMLVAAVVLAECVTRDVSAVRNDAVGTNGLYWAFAGVTSLAVVSTLHVVPYL